MAGATSHPPLHVHAYGPDAAEEHRLARAADAKALTERFPVVWVNVNSIEDPAVIEDVGKAFGLHHLALEDVQRPHQRPKVEGYDDHLYMVLRMVGLATGHEADDDLPLGLDVADEQLSLFVGEGWVVTFQERDGDPFAPVRQRIGEAASRVRRRRSDYLAYRLVDAVVDAQFPVLDALADILDDLEDRISLDPSTRVNDFLQDVKRIVRGVRRIYAPQREAVTTLQRWEAPFMEEDTRTFLRDAVDHALRALDIADAHRDLATDLRDLYLAEVGRRANDVTKVLTIVATIFIPLTFIAGVYGMNFEHMPELSSPYAYPAVLGLMGVVAGGMLVFFRRRGWI